jgi:hypothetical protein
MKTLKVFIIVAFGFLSLLACTRKEENRAATVNLEFPKTMKSMKNGVLSTQILGHLVVNVSGPGMPQSIVQNFDRCHDCAVDAPAPSAVMIDVPQGDNRLFQALAVYVDTETNQMSFYYGDATVNVAGASTVVSIVVSSLGAGTAMVSGNFGGRFLKADGTGPTGEVNIKYYPPGKPGLIIERSLIANGWFRFFGLQGVAFNYEMIDGTPLFAGQALSMDSGMFAPSDKVLRVTVPQHKRKSSSIGGTGTLKTEDPQIFVLGYWGEGASNKRVCHSMSNVTLSNMYPTSESSTASTNYLLLTSAAPPSNLFGGSSTISYQGGLVSSDSSCSTGDEFVDRLSVFGAQFNGNGSDSAINIRVPFRGRPPGQYDSSHPISASFVNGAYELSGQLLPGTKQLFSEIKFFKYVGGDVDRLGYDHSDAGFPCRDALNRGFIPTGSGTFDANGKFQVQTTAGSADKSIGLAMGICFTDPAGQIIARGAFLGYHHFQSISGSGSPAMVKLQISEAISAGCLSSFVYLKDANQNLASMPSNLQVNLSSADSNSDSFTDILFYAESDQACSTPVSSITVPANSESISFRYALNSNGTLANGLPLVALASAPGLTSDSKTLTRVPNGGMVDIEVFGPAERSNLGQCKAINITAIDTSNNNVMAEDAVVSVSLKRLNNTSAPATDIEYFNAPGCSPGSASGAIQLVDGSGTVWVKIHTIGSFNVMTSYTSAESVNFAREFLVQGVPATEATKVLVTRVDSVSNHSNQCMQFDFQSVNDFDSPIIIASGTFSPDANMETGTAGTFSDALCTTPFGGNLSITNQSSATVYVKPSHVTTIPKNLVLHGYFSSNGSNGVKIHGQHSSISVIGTFLQASAAGGTLQPSSCQLVTISLKDSFASGSTVINKSGAPVNFAISYSGADSNDFEIFSDGACTNPMTMNMSIAPNLYSTQFYIRSKNTAGYENSSLFFSVVPAGVQNGSTGPSFIFDPNI